MVFFRGFPGKFEALFEDLDNLTGLNDDAEFFFPVGDHYFVVEEVDFRGEIHDGLGEQAGAAEFLFVQGVSFAVFWGVRE